MTAETTHASRRDDRVRWVLAVLPNYSCRKGK